MNSGESFTQRVVAELAPHTPPLACCRRALVEGLALVSTSQGAVTTTRRAAARAAMQALHADLQTAHVVRVPAPRRPQYAVLGVDPSSLPAASDRLCCARTRLRGAFLGAGRLARPDGDPDLEIGCAGEAAAIRLAGDFAALGVDARIRRRRGHWLVTVRSGPAVGAALSSIGVQTGRLAFEAGRVVRDLRSGVNRRINAETANLRRTATAGVRQLESIATLESDPDRWRGLPAALREAAVLRRSHPDEDTSRLAERAGCSRSAMAGRLHRLVAVADDMRGASLAREPSMKRFPGDAERWG